MDMLPAEARERALTLPRNLMRVEQRAEPRHEVESATATLFVRGRASSARVVNISTSGTMLETEAKPMLDEHVVVAFEGCTPLHASVRWVKDGRLGLHFGRELLLA